MSSRKKKAEREVAPLLEQIRKAISDSGLSLLQLEELSGVGNGQLSRFMRDKRDLRGTSLEKVCGALRLELVQRKPKGKPS